MEDPNAFIIPEDDETPFYRPRKGSRKVANASDAGVHTQSTSPTPSRQTVTSLADNNSQVGNPAGVTSA
eukprot:5418340-Prorocentrum_lima.AAC.1